MKFYILVQIRLCGIFWELIINIVLMGKPFCKLGQFINQFVRYNLFPIWVLPLISKNLLFPTIKICKSNALLWEPLETLLDQSSPECWTLTCLIKLPKLRGAGVFLCFCLLFRCWRSTVMKWLWYLGVSSEKHIHYILKPANCIINIITIYFLIQCKRVTAIMLYHYQESLQLENKCLKL